jgi:hypothetical protein
VFSPATQGGSAPWSRGQPPSRSPPVRLPPCCAPTPPATPLQVWGERRGEEGGVVQVATRRAIYFREEGLDRCYPD